jgi:hypothetical protein
LLLVFGGICGRVAAQCVVGIESRLHSKPPFPKLMSVIA